jgi:hypothetical protein
MAGSLAPTPYPVNARAPRAPRDPLIHKNVRVARPRHDAVETRALGIADGRVTRVEPVIDASLARAVFDARRPGRPARGQGRPPAPLARLGFGGLLSGGFSEGS